MLIGMTMSCDEESGDGKRASTGNEGLKAVRATKGITHRC